MGAADVSSPGQIVQQLVDAAHAGNWRLLGALGLMIIVWVLRKVGTRYVHGWLATDRGGATLTIATCVCTVLGSQLYSGKPMSVATVVDGLSMALSAAGGFILVNKLTKPKDAVAIPLPAAVGRITAAMSVKSNPPPPAAPTP